MIIKKNRQTKIREAKLVTGQITEPAHIAAQIETEKKSANDNFDATAQVDIQPVPAKQTVSQEPEIDLFDIENIDFNQREERRRGTRRRGYRRIDDRNLVSRAQDEAENIKKYAFEEGYRKGLEQASGDIEQFKANIDNFMGAPKEVFEYIAPDILEISVDIARKIIKKEVEEDPQVLMNIIVDVLKTISKNEPRINIRVNPQSANFIKDSLPDTTYQYGIDSKINIISDPSIENGGCVFQTNNGIVDASIDTQLEIIKKTLEGI